MPTPIDERSLLERKRSHYKGSAKVPISLLQTHAESSFTIDSKNVTRLIRVFELEGCYRLEPSHHVPATISRQHFERSLKQKKIDHDQLFDPSDLPLIDPEGVIVLHGRHRLEAAHAYLEPEERWWVVDFYDDGKDSGQFIC